MKPVRTLLLAGLALLLLPLSGHANGGGYFNGGVSETGSITSFQPEGTEKVRILDEQLTVDLMERDARVEVRYILKNTAEKKTSVRFGFPVEELPESDMNEDGSEVDEPSQKKGKRKAPALEYCRNYKVTFGGKPVSATFEPEKKPTSDPRRAGLRGWLVSSVSFAPGQETTMTIRFDATYAFGMTFVSDDESADPRLFKYRLSTGAAWEGPIERGRVVIRPSTGVVASEVSVLKPVNRFRNHGDTWEWSFENLEPSMDDDIVVEAIPEHRAYGARLENPEKETEEYNPDLPRVEFIERAGKWYAAHTNYSVKASSTLPPEGEKQYFAANVKNFYHHGPPWAEGAKGSGIGEWLELAPDVAKPIVQIRIAGGYKETEALFKANGRPKLLEVELNGEHRFQAPLQDRMDLQRILVEGYSKPVKKLRLTVLDVYPGTKYPDLCIQGIHLVSRLDKKPKVQPAR